MYDSMKEDDKVRFHPLKMVYKLLMITYFEMNEVNKSEHYANLWLEEYIKYPMGDILGSIVFADSFVYGDDLVINFIIQKFLNFLLFSSGNDIYLSGYPPSHYIFSFYIYFSNFSL